jgi:hypothetical protein
VLGTKYLRQGGWLVLFDVHDTPFKTMEIVRYYVNIRTKGSFDMIYLLTAIGLTPGGSSTAHIYTQKVHRTTKKKQFIEQHKKTIRRTT